MAINLTTKAAEKTVDRFKLKSVTEGLFTAEYNFVGANTVRVHTIDNLSLGNYNTSGTDTRFGNFTDIGDTYQDMQLTQNKSTQGVLDVSNTSQQAFAKSAAAVLKQNLDEVVIPAVDIYRLGKLASEAGLVKSANTDFGIATITKSNILEVIMQANACMTNALVPLEGRVMFIGAPEAIKLKLADQLVGVDKLGEETIVNGVVGKIDACQVRIVPDSYMPASTKLLIVKRGCAVAPETVKTYRIVDSEHVDGKVVQLHLIHDCFVLDAKDEGVIKVTA